MGKVVLAGAKMSFQRGDRADQILVARAEGPDGEQGRSSLREKRLTSDWRAPYTP